MARISSVEVGKSLQVGAGEAKAFGKGDVLIRGTAYI